MLANRISGLPVVDDDGVLVGMITEGDFLRRYELNTDRRRSWLQSWLASPGKIADEYVRSHGRRVDEIMNSHLVVVPPTAALSEAVRLMERNEVKRLPVISDGRLVGIISRSDLLRALTKVEKPSAPSTQDTQISGGGRCRTGEAKLEQERIHTLPGQQRSSRALRHHLRRTGAPRRESCGGERARGQSDQDDLTWIDPYFGVALPPPVGEEDRT